MSQSLEQKRAAYAWERVSGCSEKYEKLAKAAPSLVMGNGLLQTLAFMQSKSDEKHYKDLLSHILVWLARQDVCGSFITKGDFPTAVQALTAPDRSSEGYMRATQEALAILRWIRQLAAAERTGRTKATTGGQP
ncbi:MAG TPA: type III-B CRISPR module-associated protein Cmr5 [Thermoanaerobaculaceae bacterium]|nr:type III-B CRISPR module-associated protein Cmr5 [Thermoanaerobaculaceae bacterium]HRS15462.1 type III-B CRISPR module-associated protein Cmr5 [Thermoanaerobaculaceae bacterium]